jgi:hypothetical protein
MAIKILLAGRTDVDSYFRLSGVFDAERLNHTPLLVFSAENETVQVLLLDDPRELLSLDDGTQVMGQWRGEWRSDFFQFTVGQYRQYVDAKDSQLKTARKVVKTIGPQGGFRSLQYQFVDESGTTIDRCTGLRSEAERLEAVFARYGIPVSIQKLPARGARPN